MGRFHSFIFCLLVALPSLCLAADDLQKNVSNNIVVKYIEQPDIIGEKRLTYFVWDVYDASLFAPDGIFDETKEFALSLKYLRDFKGDDIAKVSIDEIRKQGINDDIILTRWSDEMRSIFPDVKKSDILTGIRNKKGHAVFYLNESLIGTIKDRDFSKAFFDIWLGDNTSQPALRKKLLNL